MARLFTILFSMIATTLMGIAIIVVLTMGLDTTRPIVLAALGGFIVSIPVTWLVSRQILTMTKPRT